jgi:hypothetical protein
MARTIRVGITFDFHFETEHLELFGDIPSIEDAVAMAKSMTAEDIDRLVKYNEVWENLTVEVVEND